MHLSSGLNEKTLNLYWNLYRQIPQFCRHFFFFSFYKEKGTKYMKEEAYSRNFKTISYGQGQILLNLLFRFLDNENWGPECLA